MTVNVEAAANAEAAEAAEPNPIVKDAVVLADLPATKQLGGKTFVISGVFPLESSRRVGLEEGKDVVKDLVAKHGGRVTGSISKKTDYLIVGDAPGVSKVRGARDIDIPVIGLKGLAAVLQDKEPQPAEIGEFSVGFEGNGLANFMSDEEKQALRVSVSGKKRVTWSDEAETVEAPRKRVPPAARERVSPPALLADA